MQLQPSTYTFYRAEKVKPVTQRALITLPGLLNFILRHEGVSEYQIYSRSRERKVVLAKQMFCYFAWQYTNDPLKLIGSQVLTDYSNAIHGRDTICDLMFSNGLFKKKIYGVDKIIHQKFITGKRSHVD